MHLLCARDFTYDLFHQHMTVSVHVDYPHEEKRLVEVYELLEISWAASAQQGFKPVCEDSCS
jgi:hypothetical protein